MMNEYSAQITEHLPIMSEFDLTKRKTAKAMNCIHFHILEIFVKFITMNQTTTYTCCIHLEN